MSEIEIHKSKPLRGTPHLQGDTHLNCHGLFLATQAEGDSKLENIPPSQWFTDLIAVYSALGFSCSRSNSQLTIKGGTSTMEKISTPFCPKHEIVLMSLGGLFAALQIPNLLKIDFQFIPQSSLEAFLQVFKCEPVPGYGEKNPVFKVMGVNPEQSLQARDEYLHKIGKLCYHACTGTGLNLQFDNSGQDHLEKIRFPSQMPANRLEDPHFREIP